MESIAKIALRKHMLDLRSALGETAKLELDTVIIQLAIAQLATIQSQAVHVFRSFHSLREIDTLPIFNWAFENNVEVYSTVKIGEQWKVVRFTDTENFVEDQPDSLDVIIVPLLAFDYRLHRLGYGGGHYDRMLTDYPATKTIGLAYEFQRVDRIPSEDHDVALHMVVTEKLIDKP